MIELLLAAALQQAAASCNAVLPPGTPPPPNRPAWQPLAVVPDAMTLVDHASVLRDAAGFEIEIRTIFSADGAGRIRSANSRLRFQCGARTAVIRQLAAFDSAGTVITSGPPSGGMAVPRPVPPGNPTEPLLARYCTP